MRTCSPRRSCAAGVICFRSRNQTFPTSEMGGKRTLSPWPRMPIGNYPGKYDDRQEHQKKGPLVLILGVTKPTQKPHPCVRRSYNHADKHPALPMARYVAPEQTVEPDLSALPIATRHSPPIPGQPRCRSCRWPTSGRSQAPPWVGTFPMSAKGGERTLHTPSAR